MWFHKLANGEKDIWEHLRIAFGWKWPRKLITAKTREEQQALLNSTVLRVEDLGKVLVDRVKEFSHMMWADKILRLLLALKDESGLPINGVHCAMPSTL